ncbi:MAG: glycosyltransferase family 4 protein [Chloroflexi bacterium]|nr:glycosyltransferase family 4 protein [Chloroflexota bacterium]
MIGEQSAALDTRHPQLVMRVGLLGNAVQEYFGGINYVLNLARALATLPEADRPRLTLFVDTAAPNAEAFDSIRSIVDEVVPLAGSAAIGGGRAQRLSAIARRVGGLWAGEVRRAARRAGCDVLFPTPITLGARGRPAWIGWAYDLQHLHLPEFFSRLDLWRRDFYFSQLARHAPKIVVSSQDARRDWLSRFPRTALRVSVLSFTSVPLDEWYTASAEEAVAKYNLPCKFLLLPNQFWVHKNHATAFEAIRLLRDRGLDAPLICTGGTHDPRRPEHFAELKRWIKENSLNGRIRILGLLPAADQIQLVRAAAALVQPSLFEGWSTVVEEARALGKTLYLSDLPVHREQTPPGARFFSPHDPAALADLVAHEWDALVAGPQRECEEAVRRDHSGRITQYARTFLRVARATVKSGR